jgi:PiT family inorganic phosphate transporter
LEQDTWTRYGLIVVGAFGAYALGANNIANVVGVFVPVNPFKDVMIPGLGIISGVSQLYFLGSMSIVLGIYTYSQRVMKTVGKELFRLSPITALVAVLAESLVLFLFSSKGLHTLCLKAGLPAIPLVPVSASQIIVGSILGIGLAKGGKNLKFTMLGRISIGWVVAPLLAFFFSFVTLFIVQNVFEQLVHLPAKYVFNQSTLMQMKSEGVDIDRLYMVNGRTYEQERVLYLTLKNEAGMSRQTSFNIIRTAEVSKIKVSLDLVKLRRVDNQLTEQQLSDLSKLDKKTFNHQWELKNALQKYKSWETIKTPITPLDREENRQLASKMDMLCRLFSIK